MSDTPNIEVINVKKDFRQGDRQHAFRQLRRDFVGVAAVRQREGRCKRSLLT